MDFHIISAGNYEIENEQEANRHVPRFCYRKGFDSVPGTLKHSDSGWGCCFRCFQGILCEFVMHMAQDFPDFYLTRFPETSPLDLFRDSPHSIFSIHNLVKVCADQLGLRAGKWAKPSQLAICGRRIFAGFGIPVIVPKDSLFKPYDFKPPCFPALILAPSRLGIDSIDGKYLPFLKHLLDLPESLGIVCGKKNKAYYIIGYSSDQFIYFDPHVTLPAVDGDKTAAEFYKIPAQHIELNQMNPSMLFGFYAKDSEQLAAVLGSLVHFENSPFSTQITAISVIEDLPEF